MRAASARDDAHIIQPKPVGQLGSDRQRFDSFDTCPFQTTTARSSGEAATDVSDWDRALRRDPSADPAHDLNPI